MSTTQVSRQNNNEKTKMNRIEEMIGRLCPEGVKMVKLGEIGTFTRGNGLQKKDFTETGVPCIHYGQIYTHYGTFATETISKCSHELAKSLRKAKKGDLIITTTSENVEDVGKAVAWLGEEDVVIGGHECSFSHNENPKFISYLLQTQRFSDFKRKKSIGVKVIDLSHDKIADYTIPLPPLEVQRAIADVLDKFSALEAELEAELDCRKRQYEYYRERLLNFEQLPPEREKIKFVRLGEVFELRNGYTPSKSQSEFWEGGTIPWFRMEDIRQNGRVLSDSIQHITADAVKGGRLFPANSFILATTATIGEHALIIADSLANQRFTNLSVRKSLIEDIDIKYLFHYMFLVDEFCKRNVNDGSFASVDMKKLRNYLIPLPPLGEQKRIAEILDRFERLTNDLSEGLPAEIAERRRQYEHYRERLLSFGAAE